MNTRQAIKGSIDWSNMIVQGYLRDLTDADLLVRPVPGANHIAWQLGHLIKSEHEITEATVPGSMPPLPAGFAEKYTPESSKLDSAGAFHPKSVYMQVAEQQRAALLAALEKLSDTDLDKPGPEKYAEWLKSVGDAFLLAGTHWLMHAGQWAIVRRKLGRKPLF